MGAGPAREISGRAAGFCRPPAAVARAGADGRLAARARASLCRRHAGARLHPGLRDRDLLHDVQSRAGRALLRAGLRHDALLAARGRCDQGDLPQADRRAGACHAGWALLLDRGRVPRRVRECADGADQQGLLRGPDAREFRAHPEGPQSRPCGDARSAEWAADLGAARRADDAHRSRALRCGAPQCTGTVRCGGGRCGDRGRCAQSVRHQARGEAARARRTSPTTVAATRVPRGSCAPES